MLPLKANTACRFGKPMLTLPCRPSISSSFGTRLGRRGASNKTPTLRLSLSLRLPAKKIITYRTTHVVASLPHVIRRARQSVAPVRPVVGLRRRACFEVGRQTPFLPVVFVPVGQPAVPIGQQTRRPPTVRRVVLKLPSVRRRTSFAVVAALQFLRPWPRLGPLVL